MTMRKVTLVYIEDTRWWLLILLRIKTINDPSLIPTKRDTIRILNDFFILVFLSPLYYKVFCKIFTNESIISILYIIYIYIYIYIIFILYYFIVQSKKPKKKKKKIFLKLRFYAFLWHPRPMLNLAIKLIF